MNISVIIPVRDRVESLLNAVQSVLSQSYPVDQLIVVDDGSSLNLETVAQLVQAAGHTWIRQSGQGVAAARNAGIRIATSPWIAFLDSDDIWKPEKLVRQVQLHTDWPELKISQCKEEWHRNGRRVNQRLVHKLPEGEAFSSALKRCCISPSAVMLHRSLFEQYGMFDEQLSVCEDYDLWIRITSTEPVGLVPAELVVKYGGHADQLSRGVVAIDRFRLYALLKLLHERRLTREKELLAEAEAFSRIDILEKGALKRDPPHTALYENIRRAVKQNDFEQSFILSSSLLEEP